MALDFTIEFGLELPLSLYELADDLGVRLSWWLMAVENYSAARNSSMLSAASCLPASSTDHTKCESNQNLLTKWQMRVVRLYSVWPVSLVDQHSSRSEIHVLDLMITYEGASHAFKLYWWSNPSSKTSRHARVAAIHASSSTKQFEDIIHRSLLLQTKNLLFRKQRKQ